MREIDQTLASLQYTRQIGGEPNLGTPTWNNSADSHGFPGILEQPRTPVKSELAPGEPRNRQVDGAVSSTGR
mgnify:CR=1 FL=1